MLEYVKIDDWSMQIQQIIQVSDLSTITSHYTTNSSGHVLWVVTASKSIVGVSNDHIVSI